MIQEKNHAARWGRGKHGAEHAARRGAVGGSSGRTAVCNTGSWSEFPSVVAHSSRGFGPHSFENCRLGASSFLRTNISTDFIFNDVIRVVHDSGELDIEEACHLLVVLDQFSHAITHLFSSGFFKRAARVVPNVVIARRRAL